MDVGDVLSRNYYFVFAEILILIEDEISTSMVANPNTKRPNMYGDS